MRRLRHAAELLAGSERPVKEIAELSGFPDPNYFAKLSRRYLRTNPTDFRRIGATASFVVSDAASGSSLSKRQAGRFDASDRAP
ncbi:helix-turn-helix domain-containing protein [Martelella radicis]|uniref:AraC-like DNA-binding protein n=1 Tax=Martelella radicis TaxID=1397476 RepID=A0A7W6P8F9_9HYPH|nr:helix-turn-helix domain-containing protein [Martelella radicis]MBB4120296.1 AraC-like DNA-binding protein [Martelella radicis]